MDEELKEIQGLLEDAEHIATPSFKKYAKLVLPHVVLVGVVCLYAVAGAWIFYSLESPHEDRLKRIGVQRIGELRKELVQVLWLKRKQLKATEMHSWARVTDEKLQNFNEYLYRAFKELYVRYADVRVSKTSFEKHTVGKRTKRHRKSKIRSRSVRSEKLWTASSAIFFAATTMATIGYGNIVPVTPYGRIACVVFALFGAPLAIITIGDLGKFLSECTIWLYNKMKKTHGEFKRHLFKFKSRAAGCSDLKSADVRNEPVRELLDWDDLALDKTEVPVLLVFAILLLYIAFGGVLFALFESWNYMDAFYFCFVSLTTIGFGDLVPERHEYILLMLIYLGVGLAVTTMCIDLVGIQYIQKIHYFGRKFRGTDIFQLLKRKRMIERRLAMGQGDELLQLYLRQLQEARASTIIQPQWHMCNNIAVTAENQANSNIALCDVIDQAIPEIEPGILVSAEKMTTPSIHSVRSIEVRRVSCAVQLSNAPSPSLISSTSSRSLMSCQGASSTASCPVPGTDASIILSTSPSVSLREAAYQNYHEQSPSVQSFKFSFPPEPSPDLGLIADEARRSRRLHSCPSKVSYQIPLAPPEPEPRLLSPPVSKTRSPSSSISNHQTLPSLQPSSLPASPLVSPAISPIGIACMEEWDSYIKMLDEIQIPFARPEKIAAEAFALDEISVTPICEVNEEVMEQDVSRRCGSALLSSSSTSSSSSSNLELESVRPFSIDLGVYELVEPSGITAEALLASELQHPVLFHQTIPVHSVHQTTVQTEIALQNLITAPDSMLSHKLPPAIVDDNYCFVIDAEKIGVDAIIADDRYWKYTSRPTQYFYSEDLQAFQRVNCIKAKGKIIAAKLTGVQAQTFNSTPRASLTSSLPSAQSTPTHQPRTGSAFAQRRSFSSSTGFRGETVSLTHVYAVTRFYSFWKTCPSFHRIVTTFDRVEESKVMNPKFKKRLFVQYIWRNTKRSEKARVKREFNLNRGKKLRRVPTKASKHAFK